MIGHLCRWCRCRYWLVHLVVDYFVFMLSVALCALSVAHAALRIDPMRSRMAQAEGAQRLLLDGHRTRHKDNAEAGA